MRARRARLEQVIKLQAELDLCQRDNRSLMTLNEHLTAMMDDFRKTNEGLREALEVAHRTIRLLEEPIAKAKARSEEDKFLRDLREGR